MSTPDQSALMTILGEMSQDEAATSALAKLGKLLFAIPGMSAQETAVLWHLLEVCCPSATTPQAKEVIKALQISLWARMRQILREALSQENWGHGDVSQIMEIMRVNSIPSDAEKKPNLLQRILRWSA